MPSTFWSNTIWYILLGITTVVELIIIFTKSQNRKLAIALYCTVAGMPFNFETAILLFFKSYNYYPMIFPHSPYDDNLAGNYFSQLSVPATALMISVLNLKGYWYLIFAIIYSMIEELFLKLGIYKHNWYQTWMTFVGLILLFWITKKIYIYSTEKKVEGFLRYLFIFLGLFVLYMSTVWVLRLTGIHNTSPSILPDPTSSLSLVIYVHFASLSIISMVVYYAKIKLRWKALMIPVLYFAFYIVKKLKLEFFADGWLTFIIITINIFSMFLYVHILNKLYDRSGSGYIYPID